MRQESFIERRKKDSLTEHIIKVCDERLNKFQIELTRLGSEINSVRANVEINANYSASRFDSIDNNIKLILEENKKNREADKTHRESVELIISRYVTPVENAAKNIHFVAQRTSSGANKIRRFIVKFGYPIFALIGMYYALTGRATPDWIKIFKE